MLELEETLQTTPIGSTVTTITIVSVTVKRKFRLNLSSLLAPSPEGHNYFLENQVKTFRLISFLLEKGDTLNDPQAAYSDSSPTALQRLTAEVNAAFIAGQKFNSAGQYLTHQEIENYK